MGGWQGANCSRGFVKQRVETELGALHAKLLQAGFPSGDMDLARAGELLWLFLGDAQKDTAPEHFTGCLAGRRVQRHSSL